jgi:hypothetical protein
MAKAAELLGIQRLLLVAGVGFEPATTGYEPALVTGFVLIRDENYTIPDDVNLC